MTATQMRPGDVSSAVPLESEGAGKTGHRLMPMAPVQRKTHGAGTTGSAENTRPSLRNGVTTYSALSRVNGLSCHPRLAISPARLDPSVAGSGPHAFVVREDAARLATPSRPSHPASNARDDRVAPLVIGGGTRQLWHTSENKKQEYFCATIWTPRIGLNGFANFDFSRRGFLGSPGSRATGHAPHVADSTQRRALGLARRSRREGRRGRRDDWPIQSK